MLAGGFGSAVLEHLADRDLLGSARVLRFGLPTAVAERVAQAVLEPSLA